MTKVFKNSKQVLSFVIAFAIIAVSLFTGVAINADAATANILYYSGTPATSIANVGGGDGSSADKAIIIASAEEFAYLVKLGKDGTVGKHYKFADSIDAIILQKEDIATIDSDNNGVYDIMECSSYEETKAFFEDKSKTLTSWFSGGSTANIFAGSFDGNGVKVYGAYYSNTGAWANTGLFTNLAPTSDIKNLSVNNCYFAIWSYVGAIAGYAENKVVAGTIEIDNCEVVNCYIYSFQKSQSRAGLFVGSIQYESPIGIYLKNSLAYGNRVEGGGENSTEIVEWGIFGSLNNANLEDEASKGFNNQFENSVILDTIPYVVNGGTNTQRPQNFNNLYTNKTELPYIATNYPHWLGGDTPEVTFEKHFITPGKITIVGDVTGSAAKVAMPKLDWENTWFATEDGPRLRVFHNLTAVTPDANGHGYKCADCDINAVVAHAWGEDFKCVECGYACKHDGGNLETTNTSGDCVTAPGQYVSCKECGYSAQFTTGTAPGHMFEHKEGVPADCLTPGVYDYWHCTVCDGNYLGDKEELLMAPIADGKKDPAVDFVSPLGGHSQKTDVDGVIVIVDGANGHYYECSVCDGKLNHKSEEIAKDEVIKHDFSASVCKQCGWKCEEHDYELTGNVLVVGDCNTDHEDELKCKICGKQESEVTKASHKIVAVEEVKATDKIEGTKAHYQCTECKSIYADAEGKTSVTKASLVVPKKLPAGYENTYGGTGDTTAPENADTSTTSPATSDNVITVIATAVVLMGAAYVVVRKIVKA